MTDPRWIDCRYSGTCSDCGRTIPRAARALWWGKGRLFCLDCGEPKMRRFRMEAEDEEVNSILHVM